MRIVFLGTPEFAVPSLEALHSARHEIGAVFTQPDRPKGRGNQLSESPVKLAAKRFGLDIYQPERIRRSESVEQLKLMAPEVMVVVGYGQIIPQSIIDVPRFGILNVHASLLPKYRGAAPIQWAIANGESKTGITIMQIDAGLDTGDMLLKSSLAIHPDETAPELSVELASLGAGLLIEAIRHIESGTVVRERQNNEDATYAPVLKKEDGRVDWSRTARQIYDRLRGFIPWPGAYTTFRGQQLSILRAKPAQQQMIPEGALRIHGRHLYAGCGEGTALELLEVQPSGKKRISADSFLNGYKLEQDEVLGA